MPARFGVRLALGLAAMFLVASVIFVKSSAQDERAVQSPVVVTEVDMYDRDAAQADDDVTFVGPVTVTATAGTTGPTDYPTLKDAFDAINLGTHQGAITVSIVTNTTETASAVLNSGAVPPAVYTSVLVQPLGGARTVSGSIVGAIIKLNGADNVTIDGRIAGVGRNLSVINNNTSAATAAIWLASVAAGNGASNNIIRNLELAAGANQTAVTSATFGIIMSGTTISTTSNGVDNDNNSFIANRIIRVRYGILTRGTNTDNNLNPVVTDNIVGPEAFGPDQIGKTGIFMQFDTGGTVSRNTVQTVGTLITQAPGFADHCGICIGTESWGVTDSATATSGTYTVTRNVIHDIIEEKTGSAIGIKLGTTQSGGATNNLVANNFVYNIRANGTAGDQFVGIGISGGNGDKVVFNSISITGDVDPAGTTASSTWGGAIRIPGANAANNANFTLMDNSIHLDVNSNTATQHYFAITLNSAAYVFGTGGLNYNNYYINAANPQLRTGGLGTATTTGPGTEFLDLPAWKLALAPPIYDVASIQANPLHFSPTADLHIPTNSPNVDFGDPIAGIVDDIDAQARPNGPNPDIGADEAYASPGTLQFSSATYNVTETGGTATITITRAGGSNGAASVDYATVAGGSATGGAACAPGVDYVNTSGTKMWADLDFAPQTFAVTICPDGVFEAGETVNLAVTNATGATLGTPNTAVLTIIDAGSTFSGPYNVGTGEFSTSLTNPGGIFNTINNGVVSGNVTINITSDLAGETGAIALNEFAAGFTLTIKPSGVARTITGSSAAGMIPFNGADMVTIDGSLSGGTDRSLTVTNTGSGGGITFSTGVTLAGAEDNTVKNVNIIGGSPTATIIGIAFQGNTFGSAGADNDNNRVENCNLGSSIYGIYSVGASAANKNTGVVITRNQMTGTGSARIGRIGIFVGFDDGIQVTENNIDGIVSGEGADAIAIAAGTQSLGAAAPTPVDLTNALISRNRIGLVQQTATFSAAGIALASGTSGTNTVSNNMISGVIANANGGDIVAGIYVIPIAGATQNIYHNSVSNSGDRGATASQYGSFGLAIGGTDQLVNVRNNILMNTQTQTGGGAGGRSYAIGTAYSTFANLTSDVNDLFVSGPQATLGITGGLLNVAGTGTGTDRIDLAAWQLATGEDAGSFSVDPLYVDPLTNLHLQAASPMINVGAAGTGVLIDFDGDTRPSGTQPEIGADEIVEGGAAGVLAFSSPTYTIGEAGVQATITVTRTGGSSGTVGVSYATVAGGNATGGAACGGTVDYVNTSGTLSFPDTNTSQTFNVPICSDALDELDETVNLQLTLPTGGATIGTQSTAVLTITDDDATPSLAIASPSPAAAPETNVGSHTVTFFVSLSAASGQTVTVHYQTNDGSATTANNDYVGILDTVMTFNPGETSKTIDVTVNGDFTPEPDETFTVDLSLPSAATIGTGSAGATILNDDGSLSTFSINDVRTKESNAGTHTVTFTVSLFSPGSPPGFASVQYATGGGTATAGASDPADYMSASGTLNFGTTDGGTTPEGSSTQTQTFNVTIIGDVNKEPNETFFVTLSNPINGAIGDGLGVCIIFDEDRAYVADFDRDLKTDLSVFRPDGEQVDGVWYIKQSTNGITKYEKFGDNGDKIVPGDYDADGLTDLAVFRPSSGSWFIERSSDFGFVQFQWGLATDLPVQGDYDGDDKTDVAVFRPSDGTWYVLRSSDAAVQTFQWGAVGDKVVPGDYDGDGKADFAVFRPSTGTWYVQPNTGTSSRSIIWGTVGDIPVSGDFDGDGSTDIAVFRPSDGNWYISTSLNGSSITLHWGQSGDIPVVGDYDADGISDIAVWRPTTGDWYVLNSNDPAPPFAPDAVIPAFDHWGRDGDKPVPASYVPEQ